MFYRITKLKIYFKASSNELFIKKISNDDKNLSIYTIDL